jgi:hypothetical protein
MQIKDIGDGNLEFSVNLSPQTSSYMTREQIAVVIVGRLLERWYRADNDDVAETLKFWRRALDQPSGWLSGGGWHVTWKQTGSRIDGFITTKQPRFA